MSHDARFAVLSGSADWARGARAIFAAVVLVAMVLVPRVGPPRSAINSRPISAVLLRVGVPVSGPDGAIWVTEVTDEATNVFGSIVRTTNSGVMWKYTDRTISHPEGIASGPDGALWFTNTGNNSIGRITTAGVVSRYTAPTISGPEWITVGPDGALWFTNTGNDSIGRITTAGVVTNFTDSSVHEPRGITSGPDGALWFTDYLSDAIGRITTTGVITHFTEASIKGPVRITSGPDGALWFTNSGNGSIGRITTKGVVSHYDVAAPVWGITSGPDHSLWFTAAIPNGDEEVGRLNTDGRISVPYPDVYATEIAAGNADDLWATGASTPTRLQPDTPVLPRLSLTGCRAREGSSCSFVATLSAASAAPVSVDYTTRAKGSAAPSDFTKMSGTLVFAPGVVTREVAVPLTDDDSAEPTEDFGLVLVNPHGAQLNYSDIADLRTDVAPPLEARGVINDGTVATTVSFSAAEANAVNQAWQKFGADPAGPLVTATRLTRYLDAVTPGGLGVVSPPPTSSGAVAFSAFFSQHDFAAIQALARRIGLDATSFQVFSARLMIYLAATTK
jgi:virginiamycin B lyase